MEERESAQKPAANGTRTQSSESPATSSGKDLASSAKRMLRTIGSRGNLRSMFSSSDSTEADKQPPVLLLDGSGEDDEVADTRRSTPSPLTINEDISSGRNSDFWRDSDCSEPRGSDAERRGSGKGKQPQQQNWLRNILVKNKLNADENGARSGSPSGSPRAAEARNLAAVKAPPPEIRMSREDSFDSTAARSPLALEPVLEHQETNLSDLTNKRSPNSTSHTVLQKSRSPGAHDATGRQGRFPSSPLGSPVGMGSKRPGSSTSERHSFAGGELTPRRSFTGRPRSGSSERGDGLPRPQSSGGLKRTQSAYSNISTSSERRGRERSRSVERDRPTSASVERAPLQRVGSSNSIRPPFRRRSSSRARLPSATRRRTNKFAYATPEDRAAAKIQAIARAILARQKLRRRKMEFLLNFEGEMMRGRNVVKHPRSGNPRAVTLVLTKLDGKTALSWGGRGHVFVSDITHVKVGIHTPVLAKRANPLEPEWYFSIFTDERSLDIETQSPWSSYYFKVGFTLLAARQRQRAPEESTRPATGRNPLVRFLSRRDKQPSNVSSTAAVPPAPQVPPTPMPTPVMNLKKPLPPPETPQTCVSSESGLLGGVVLDDDDDGATTTTSSNPERPELTHSASAKLTFEDLPVQRATVNLTQMNSQLQSLREQARDSLDGSMSVEEREQAFFDSLVKASKHQAKQEFRTERERAIYAAVESANKQREKEKTKLVQERSQLYAKGTAEQIMKNTRRKSEAYVSPARARIAESRRRSLQPGDAQPSNESHEIADDTRPEGAL